MMISDIHLMTSFSNRFPKYGSVPSLVFNSGTTRITTKIIKKSVHVICYLFFICDALTVLGSDFFMVFLEFFFTIPRCSLIVVRWLTVVLLRDTIFKMCLFSFFYHLSDFQLGGAE